MYTGTNALVFIDVLLDSPCVHVSLPPPCRNEREGIPVDLIHHLDQCVEIPQLGLVRSLNVHVSGALMVWEFAKQHLIGQD